MNPISFHMFLLAQGVPGAQGVKPDLADGTGSGWMVLVLILAVLGLPLLGGILAEKLLGLKNIAGRVSVVLFALCLALSPFVTRLLAGGNLSDAIRLGIDLAGGTNMVFAVDREGAEAAEKEITGESGAAVMDRMVGTIARRINRGGVEEVTVRRVGQDRIEIIVPGADSEQAEQIKRDVTKLGELEFAILADRREDAHLPIIELARQTEATDVRNSEGNVIAQWRPVANIEDKDEPKPVYPSEGNITRTVTTPDGEERTEFLVVVDPDPQRRITGRLLKSARETIGESGPVVGFTFNTRGGRLFQQVTTRYQPREGAGYKHRLAVLLNKEIHSAPQINSIIGASGIIEGQFTSQEIEALVNVLNAGALEVPLREQPVSEFTVSPLLGIDVQEKGKTAIIVAAVTVFVFMLAYYWWAGAVADICLIVNLILVMGTMAFIEATFTLPGLAGLVLTIGMAVDANVLIFERIREEQNKGSSLRMAIQNGFSRALTTIVDANVTTLITAVVLYMIGTDQVKGFAVTLFIGIVMSMFSALYLGRLIFDIMERKRWISEVKMASIVGKTEWNFISKTKLAALCSAALIVVGMGSFFARGQENLDIDFRGGSMVTFRFEDTPGVDEVRSALAEQFESSITLEQLRVEREGGTQTLYRLRTVEQDADKVADAINRAFEGTGHTLVRQHLEVGAIEPIAAPESPAGEDEPAPAEFNPFAGGHQVTLSFAEPISALSVRAEMAEALGSLGDGATPAYDEPELLLSAINDEAPQSETVKGTSFTVKTMPLVSGEDLQAALAALERDLTNQPNFEEVNTFDSAVASEARIDAMLALFFSLVAIVAYIWFRFQRITFGLAAVAALVHDVLCVLGLVAIASYLSGNPVGNILALEDFKINLPMIAAFMTIVGYSLNDTIVVFDRIREVRGKNPALTEDMVNLSLNQTLSRTLLTSLTTMIVVLILYAIGGEGIHGFAFCLVLGVLVGTYSSMYIASPVLLWLMNRRPATR
jgi:SecD/SecF fusion protein